MRKDSIKRCNLAKAFILQDPHKSHLLGVVGKREKSLLLSIPSGAGAVLRLQRILIRLPKSLYTLSRWNSPCSLRFLPCSTWKRKTKQNPKTTNNIWLFFFSVLITGRILLIVRSRRFRQSSKSRAGDSFVLQWWLIDGGGFFLRRTSRLCLKAPFNFFFFSPSPSWRGDRTCRKINYWSSQPVFLPSLIRSVRISAAWEMAEGAEYWGKKRKQSSKQSCTAKRLLGYRSFSLRLSGCGTLPRGGDVDDARVSLHFRTVH